MDATLWQRLKPCLEQYPIDVVRVHPVAPGRFRVDSSTRTFEGRVVSHDSAIVRQSLCDYLAQRKFRSTQRPLLNLYHDRLIVVDDVQSFHLTDGWYAPALQVTHDDLLLAVRNLAFLHNAISDYGKRVGSTGVPVKKRTGMWEKTLEQGMQWIATERVLADSKRQQPDGAQWYDWLSRWQEQAQQSLDALRRGGYSLIVEASRNNDEMAWNGYRLENLIQRPSGKVVTLQIQDPVFDSTIYDLATLCQEVCEAGHADGVEEAISIYADERPLCLEEKQVIRSFAAFPHYALTTLRKVRMDKEPVKGDGVWQQSAMRQWSAAKALLSGKF
jgi:hypothetical protein